uniref:Uncharacterized protein n=1 Tax=Vespula pensylvanica TaxID=30213 RepID=A0A834JN39_VESPE|nr:hypothetical protein H0235_017683 [Vespula pensylvanica]
MSEIKNRKKEKEEEVEVEVEEEEEEVRAVVMVVVVVVVEEEEEEGKGDEVETKRGRRRRETNMPFHYKGNIVRSSLRGITSLHNLMNGFGQRVPSPVCSLVISINPPEAYLAAPRRTLK